MILVIMPYGQLVANFSTVNESNCCTTESPSMSDACCSITTSTACSMEAEETNHTHDSEQKIDHHDFQDCDNNCTGNCGQNGCHVNSISLKLFYQHKHSPLNNVKWQGKSVKIFGYDALHLQDITYSIWHPPKIV
ncbi:MAG: hypothetical protein Q4F57_07725 [Weeksellaceae bacterium]|nr:hypothetical protein [Weeksellaceae bacterium]